MMWHNHRGLLRFLPLIFGARIARGIHRRTVVCVRGQEVPETLKCCVFRRIPDVKSDLDFPSDFEAGGLDM